LFILDKCFAASHEDLKQDIFQGRARPSLGVVHRYIKYIKKREASRAAACRPALLAIPPFAVGSYPFVRGWVLHSPLDFTPSSLAPTVGRWALPFVVGPYRSSSSGPTVRRRWALPFDVVFYALRRWALPFVVVFYALRRWVLAPEGSGCDRLRVV